MTTKKTKAAGMGTTDGARIDVTVNTDAAAAIARARAAAYVGTSPEAAFAHFRPLAEGVSPADAPPFRGVPMVMHAVVQQAIAAAEPGFAAAVGELRDPRIEEALELPPLVLALQYASGRVPGAKLSEGEIARLLAEQAPVRAAALDYLEVAAGPAVRLVPAARVAAIRAGKGTLDMAQDFVAIPGLFREFEEALRGKHPFGAAQLARLGEVGEVLLQQVRPASAPREASARGPEATLRDQFGALVTRRYERLLLLADAGLGRARAREVMPALYAVERAPKAAAKDDAKGGEVKGGVVKAGEVKAGEVKRPSAAPVARPSAPPPA